MDDRTPYEEAQRAAIALAGDDRKKFAAWFAAWDRAITPAAAPVECLKCGKHGPMHKADADHAGWLCQTCYEATRLEIKDREDAIFEDDCSEPWRPIGLPQDLADDADAAADEAIATIYANKPAVVAAPIEIDDRDDVAQIYCERPDLARLIDVTIDGVLTIFAEQWGVESFDGGDGSEDFWGDVGGSVMNLLAEAGLEDYTAGKDKSAETPAPPLSAPRSDAEQLYAVERREYPYGGNVPLVYMETGTAAELGLGSAGGTEGQTPGPWIVDECNTPNGKALEINHLWVDEDGETRTDNIATVCMDYRGDRAECNARLLAAAPEMYSTLKALVAENDRAIFISCHGLFGRARQVIAIVEGGNK